MSVKYTDDWMIEDLDFTITVNSKCNLSCSYCPLINENKALWDNILDEYINFFINNEYILKKYVKNIVIIFFWWEAIIDFDKIKYFLSKMYNYWIYTKYVIYTNWILINKEIVNYLINFQDFYKRIIFSISIDWDFNWMKKNRLTSLEQFNSIITNIKLLSDNNFKFSVSKVIYEKSHQELYNNFYFLHLLKPNKLDFLPVSFYHDSWYSYEHIKEIIKWLNLFISKLLLEGKNHLEIMEYLWLPDTLEWLKKLYKSDYGFFWDLNGNVNWIIDWLSIFSTKFKFNINEQKEINIANIKEHDKLIKIIADYKNFEKKYFDLWKKWHEREFSNEIKYFNIISIYLIKKLLIYKYIPNDLKYV